jgi:hypothetical protein
MAKVLEKHKKYKEKYGSDEVYWGLGVEEETYLQFTKPIYVAAPILRLAHKPERYSLDYYKIYKPGHIKAFEILFPDSSGCFPLPFFLNAHCFQKLDLSGNHATTYEKVPKPNKKYAGKSFLDELQVFSPRLKDDYEVHYTFDGDSIEFMTLAFYKAKAANVVKELVTYKASFLAQVNRFLIEKRRHRDKGLLMFPPRNPGFAVFFSNPANVSMFNNGTYHINITLPSMLAPSVATNELAPLAFPELFKQQHRQCIRMIQWLEPLMLVVYGTPDPLAVLSRRYARSSQRCSVARYIGVGTYDSVEMPEGKILTSSLKNVRGSSQPFWWYSQYHKISGYNPLDQIGMDINYKKHYNHGIELRIFDWFAEERLLELISFIVYLCDAALLRDEASEAVMSPSWNRFVMETLREGPSAIVTDDIAANYERLLGVDLLGKQLSAKEAFEYIFKELKRIYKNGICAKCML